MTTPVIGYKGEELNLLVRQGATFGPVTCTLTNPDTSPVDLTSVTFRGQVRKTPATPEIAAVLTFTVSAPLTGVFTWHIPDSVTALLAAGDTETDAESTYVWDMEMVSTGSVVTPLCYGTVNVFREVTK